MARDPQLDPLSFDDTFDRLLPAIAIFGDPLLDRPIDRSMPVDMTALKRALAELDGFAVAAHRATAAATLHSVVACQADSLESGLEERQNNKPTPEPRSAVQKYFRTRTATLSADHMLWHCLRVIAEAAEDIVDAPISGSDLMRLGSAITTVLDEVSGPEGGSSTLKPITPPTSDLTIEEIWLRRWIIGHQLHAMLNVHAAYALKDAADALRCGRHHAAVDAICSAVRLVKGFAGARAQALALPADFYQEVLRPTMLPPLTDVPLSGRMHVEYQGYRRRMDDLLKLLPHSGAQLAAAQPRLALAVEHLVEADLVDSERHVTSVEPLVGDSRSLIQTSKSTENAVSALRRIRHRRAAKIVPHVRFPDHVLQLNDHETDQPGCP